jgi:hypothetical protein
LTEFAGLVRKGRWRSRDCTLAEAGEEIFVARQFNRHGINNQPMDTIMTKFIQALFAGYIAIGLVLYLVQSFGGRSCDSLLGERHTVGRENLVLAVAMWLPDFVQHVMSGSVPLSEYLAPTRCTSK